MPSPTRRVARSVQVQRNSNDLEIAEKLAVSLQLDLIDETVHRLGDAREVVSEPLAVELRRHRLVILGSDVDDASHVTDGSVIARSIHRGNELVLRVLGVLVVLA